MDNIRAELCELWPLYALVLRTPHLELKLPTELDLVRLVREVKLGVHDPGWVPMGSRWNLQPSPQLEQGFIQHHAGHKAGWSEDAWRLALAVYIDGEPVGSQVVGGKDFTSRRTAETGSWIGKRFQGRGYGTEMRQAVAWLAFEVLGAQALRSGYWHDNAPSGAVSRKLGYQVLYGEQRRRELPDGNGHEMALSYEVRLTPDCWNRPDYPVIVEGFEPCGRLFGL